MLELSEEVIKWRNRVNSRDDQWTVDVLMVDENEEESQSAYSDARLYERANNGGRPTDRIMRALAGFFTSREWTLRQRGQRKNKQYTIDAVRRELRDVLRWNGVLTSGDNGYQRFRTSKSTKEGEGRDMNWAFVSG